MQYPLFRVSRNALKLSLTQFKITFWNNFRNADSWPLGNAAADFARRRARIRPKIFPKQKLGELSDGLGPSITRQPHLAPDPHKQPSFGPKYHVFVEIPPPTWSAKGAIRISRLISYASPIVNQRYLYFGLRKIFKLNLGNQERQMVSGRESPGGQLAVSAAPSFQIIGVGRFSFLCGRIVGVHWTAFIFRFLKIVKTVPKNLWILDDVEEFLKILPLCICNTAAMCKCSEWLEQDCFEGSTPLDSIYFKFSISR